MDMQRGDRVRSLTATSRFRVGAWLVHPERLAIENDHGERALEPRLMEVLVALAERAGDVVSAEQLLIEVWHGTFYGDNPVHRVIAELRRALGDSSRTPEYIETIRKRGYRLLAPVAFPDDYRRRPGQVDGWAGRDPFVGLTAFAAGHAGVFFGRSDAMAALLSAMRTQFDEGRRFVLVVGASGCGKTSLLRAGVLPLLEQPGGFDGLRALSTAHCDFAAAQGDALAVPLAAALSTWTIGDRPVFSASGTRELATRMADDPASIGIALDEALRRNPAAGRHGDRNHLLLVVDHAEALVASPRMRQDERLAVWRIVDAICAHPAGMVTMIARSDFYPALIAALPGMVGRKAGDGHIDVLAPNAGEIAQIIRMPASLAGLTFEEAPGSATRLDDTLRDAAIDQPDALPLLQHTLKALYERRSENGTLTFSAYREIGGLEGALAHRAETVFEALGTRSRASLERVLSRLVVVQSGLEGVSARRVLSTELEDDDARELVERFVQARLFVAGLGEKGPDFGVAHEALLRQWPRAQAWIQDNRRMLHARARLRQAATRWREAGRSDDLLLHPGQPLIEARDAARWFAEALSPDERALLDASERQRRRARRLRTFAIASLAALAVTASASALWALGAQREAERRREQALRLSDYMLVEVADTLRPLGDLKLLGGIGREALALLDREDATQLTAPDQINRARALRTVGEVMMDEAKLDAAYTAFVGADRAARAAMRSAPQSLDAIAEAGIAAYWLGYCHFRRNEFAEARKQWDTYLQRTDALLLRAPDDPRWLVERSYALNNLGTLARTQGRIEEATARFHASAALKTRVLRQRPDDLELRFELIDTLSWISTAEEQLGRLQSASEGNAEQIAMLRTLVAARPEARAWARRLATSLKRSAGVELALGRIDQARRQLDESIDRLSALIAQAPDNRVWQRDLAHALLERAEIARIEGDAAGAWKRVERADATIRGLSTDTSGRTEWRRLDALVRGRKATLSGDAVAEARAIDDLARLQQDTPDDVAGRTALARALIARARRAPAHRDDALRVIDLLSSVAPASSDPNLLAPWLEAHALLGRPLPGDAHERLQRSGFRHPDHQTILARATGPAKPGA
jgi:DNA-binding winged helix-turn-helix (wHTH) protein/tetratricopeptide (TPR) repeat protein/energy-coupling factor transporter ATP-binding protein EcfA2